MGDDSFAPANRVIPMIAYEDAATALDWLTKAFSFRETTRMTDADGTVTHAEMDYRGGVIMLATPTPKYEGPKRHRMHCEAAREWSKVPYMIDGIMVTVDDVDAHFNQAKAAGAHILSEPAEQPYGRVYRAEDLEGHRWMFVQSPK